jgi:hypothetical protein
MTRVISLLIGLVAFLGAASATTNVTNAQDCITRGKNCPKGPKKENPCCQTNYPVYCLDGICIEITTEEEKK